MPSPDRPRSLSGFAEKNLGTKPSPKPIPYKDARAEARKRKTA